MMAGRLLSLGMAYFQGLCWPHCMLNLSQAQSFLQPTALDATQTLGGIPYGLKRCSMKVTIDDAGCGKNAPRFSIFFDGSTCLGGDLKWIFLRYIRMVSGDKPHKKGHPKPCVLWNQGFVNLLLGQFMLLEFYQEDLLPSQCRDNQPYLSENSSEKSGI